jgi:hypothetical protein
MATKVASPASGAFPELLRRSRFASFDPTICQSYGTPPSHLHRGNWGLKRPIAQRKRNAFISLKNFEEHEHYIEWNNAETQVRLIDKIEEINFAPKLVPQVSWYTGLGPAASSPWSRMDSDFAPGESGMPILPKSIPLFTTKLEGLGRRGKGEYGAKSSNVSDDGYLHPNLRAMSPKVFNRYIKKLRSLRPEFKKFLKENGDSESIRESGIQSSNLHIRFLGQHFDKQFQDTRDENRADIHPNQPQPIRQQPHRVGGLMYASPTVLESFFNSRAYPGIVLEDGSRIYRHGSSNSSAFLVSTAGIIGRLEGKRAGPDVKPAFNSGILAYPAAKLLAGRTRFNNFINVKVIDLQLESLPIAVTAFPSKNSSRDVSIRMQLAIHSENDHSRTNTHPLGSMLYNVPEDSQQPNLSKKEYNRYSTNHNIYKYPPTLLDEGGPVNKPLEEEDETSSDNDGMLDSLEKIQTGSSKSQHLGKVDAVMKEMSWRGRQRKNNWEDDQWIEPRNPDGDGGDK